MHLPSYAIPTSEAYDKARTIIEAANAFVEHERLRLANPEIGAKPAKVDTRAFRDARRGRRGLRDVEWEIEAGHVREVDDAVFLLVKVLSLCSARFGLGSNRAGKSEGAGRFYPNVRFPLALGTFQLLRVIRDAPRGASVRENRANYRNYRGENLGLRKGNPEMSRPSKFRLGRTEMLVAASEAMLYRNWSFRINVVEFKKLLTELLEIADQRISSARVYCSGRCEQSAPMRP